MEKKPEQIHPDQWLKDLPLPTPNEGFKPEQMLICPKCSRLSPPNRLKCFYCSAELPVADLQLIMPNLRKLELWEKGFNVILLPDNSVPAEEMIADISRFLKIESEDLQKILSIRKPLPVVRSESEREAEIIAGRLRELNIESLILNDEKLKVETPARRLRGIEFRDDKLILILFNSGAAVKIPKDNLSLIVSGAMIVRKIESIENYKRKDENKILETTEISNDEVLIDIYDRADLIGYRIESKGFDFSCLGGEKQLLAKENIKKLSETLRGFAHEAKFDDDYKRVRAELSLIWEVGQSRDSKGVQKKGFGKVNLESVTTVDNLSQFTKYSRLQWHLL